MALAKRSFLRLTPDLTRAAVKCVGDTFGAQDDPFTSLFNLRRHDWEEMSSLFINRASVAKTPLSVVAFNHITGEVDGVMINEDWVQQPPSGYRTSLGHNWRPVRSAFRHLHESFTRSPASRGASAPGQSLHCLYFTCVRPSARGQGVMKGLWNSTIDVARDHNFRYVLAEAGVEHVRQVLQTHLGFSEVASVDYSTFTFDGKPVYAELQQRDPAQYSRLSLMQRRVPSDLYV